MNLKNKLKRIQLAAKIIRGGGWKKKFVIDAALRYINNDQVILISDTLEKYVLYGYLRNPAVRAIVDKISGVAARIRWREYQGDPDGEFEPVTEETPLKTLFRRPNAWQGGINFRQEALIFYALTGTSLIHGQAPLTGPDRGRPIRMVNAPSPYMKPVIGDVINPVKAWEPFGQRDKRIPAEQVMMFRTPNPDYSSPGSWLMGCSKIKSALLALTSSNDGYERKAATLQNGGAVGFLKLKNGDAVSAEDWGDEEIMQFQEEIMRSGRAGNAGFWGFTPYDVEFVKTGDTLVQSGVLDSIMSDWHTMANVYEVSMELFSTEKQTTFENREKAMKSLYWDVVIPLLDQWKDEWNRWIIPKFYGDGTERWIAPDFSDIPILKPDMGDMAQKLAGAWWLTPRKRYEIMDTDVPESLEESEFMDTLFVPGNLIPVEDLQAEAQINELVRSFSRQTNGQESNV